MAAVYILSSAAVGHFYIESCFDFKVRITQHKSGEFNSSYTSNHTDWELYFKVDQLDYKQARKIEAHIKRMKSRKYITNLLRYPEIMERLIKKYSE